MKFISNKTIFFPGNTQVIPRLRTNLGSESFDGLVTLIKSKPNDKYCWKESQLEVDLSNANKTIQFDQIGFKLRIHLQTSNKVTLVCRVHRSNTFILSLSLSLARLENQSIEREQFHEHDGFDFRLERDLFAQSRHLRIDSFQLYEIRE